MMWKKLLIALVAFIGTVTVGFAYYNTSMSGASKSTYQAGGEVNGRLGSAFVKGDRIITGIVNPQTGKPMIWQLLINEKYTDYGCTTSTACSNSLTTGYIALSTESIGRSDYGLSESNFLPTVWSEYMESKVYKNYMAPFNASINERNRKIINYRNLTNFRNCHWYYSYAYALNDPMFQNNAYLLFAGTVQGIVDGGNNIASKDLFFHDGYWSTQVAHDNGWSQYDASFITATGVMGNQISYAEPKNTAIDPNFILEIRPALTLNLSDVVFAVSSGTQSGIANVTIRELDNSYTDIRNVDGQPMKLRILNDNMNATLHGIKGKSGNYTNQAGENQVIKLSVSANAGSDEQGNPYTISAIILSENGKFLKYLPLSTTVDGENEYELNLTDLTIGNYKIAVVNEAYNEGDFSPADCSALSDQISLEILPGPKFNYHAVYSGTPSVPDTYEYHVNVNADDIIGKFTVQDGVRPLQLSIISDDEATTEHANDYQSFALSQLELMNNNEVFVSVTNDLNQGDYYFKIMAEDDCGTIGYYRVHLIVNKITPKIAFNQSEQTKKSITEAELNWDEPANATPSNGVKITYSKVGGDIGLIDIDPDTGTITYQGNGAYGKVTIRATADDDPTSGNDNYDSVYTEKEIVLYAQVDGSVTPDPKSSDANTPTFTASDANVKTGGKIGTIVGAPGTPDNVSSGTITYTYGLKNDGDGSFFAVNSSTGVITSKANLAVGTYHITVTVSDKWSTKEIPVTVNVGMSAAEDLQFYETKTSSKVINTKTVNFTDTNVSVFATVKGSSNSNPVKYEIKDGSTNVIEVNPTSGAVTIHGAGTVTIVATKKGSSGQADAQVELTFTVTAGAQNFIYTDSTLKQELPKSGTKYKAYEEVYAPNKTFQVYTAGNPAGSTVTYQLKAGSPTDVIEVDPDGTIHILNASMSTQIGKVIVEATSHDPSGNYDDKTIELPITITKATQTVSFKEDPIYAASGKGSVTPVIESQDISSNAGGANVEDTKTLISVSSSVDKKIAKTTDGQTITYDYDKEGGIDIPIHVIKQGNRNYEKAEADGTLHIMGPDESILVVSDVGEVEYGEHFTIESLQDDSASVNVQYTFTVDDTTYITSPTVSGNMAEFDAIKITGSKKVTVTITRTADSEKPLSVKKQITVVPKEIEITIEDKEKYKGEENPELTYEDFSDQLVEWNGIKDVIQTKDIKLSTTAQTNSPAGDYPIKGDSAYLNKTYPNYKFTFEEGTLTIIEENIEDDWYHLETDDGNAYDGGWTNQDVNIVSNHDEYTKLSPDQSTWKANFITISKEGNNEQSFWMKKDSGATTAAKKERIKIDKQAPKVKKITAKDSNNKLQDIINKLSGGIFFKPGTTFEINTDDSNAKLEVSGTESIAYKLYKRESDLSYGSPIIEDTLAVTNEKASITINDTAGTYKVCVIPTDKAGNEGTESCHEVTLKKINVDVDDDGKPDFNDPDGDGCPDLNIKWKDDDGQWVVINGDRDNDGIPDFNIDSDGDGKPDLNLDTDNDGKPDLNLVILTKAQWKPTICVNADEDKGIKEEYCTGTSVKPQINVDLDDDGIPDINIDNKGDFKPHINIAKDGQTATMNLVKINVWKPDKNFTVKKFAYDTMNIEPLLNIDTDDDGLPDLNLDLDGDEVADINIDIDGDMIPDTNIDSTGDGEADVNIDIDGDGVADENIVEIKAWKPEHNVDGEFPYDTMTSFDDSDEPDDPSDLEEPDDPTDSDTDVKGGYYPGDNMGGALTGDNTNMMMYMGIGWLSLGMMLWIVYKRKAENE